MAYVEKTWECGETITANDLNRMEDGIQEALDCCGGGYIRTRFIEEYDSDTDTYTYVQYDTTMTPDELFDSGNSRLMIVDIMSTDDDVFYTSEEYILGCNPSMYFSGFFMNPVDRSEGGKPYFTNLFIAGVDNTWTLEKTSFDVLEQA